MKAIVADGRDFKDWELLYKTLDEKIDMIDEIVCGGARES